MSNSILSASAALDPESQIPALAEARKEMAALEKRLLAEIETKASFYTGTFKHGQAYRKGQGCTHGVSMWIALRDYPGTPGMPDSGWKLAVKKGRDAR